jgi:hydroxypyruvate isomerase
MTVAANLSMLFTELPPLERFHAAKAAGFTEVEFLFPYDVGVDAIAEVLAREALSMVLINAPAGNWIDGERGLLADPRQEEAFWSSLETGLAACVTLNCHKLHVLGGCPLPIEQLRSGSHFC